MSEINNGMKVGLYLENKNISEVDLSEPEKGNPGIGGTEYNFLTLPIYFNKHHSGKIEFVWYANSTKNLPDCISSREVDGCLEAALKAEGDNCDFLIWRPTSDERGREFINKLDEINVSVIAWIHNTPNEVELLDKMAKSSTLKRFVCVSQEQVDRLRDHPIFYKSVCIFNGFDPERYTPKKVKEKKGNEVVYIGSLVHAKGFHLLAEAWQKIIERVPSAKLKVIGSGKLYNRNQELGKWNIAEESYENQWRRYLADGDGTIHDSVDFKGTLGTEKIKIIKNANVGVVNPSGRTENCPGSAIEFQAAGVPVVSGAYRGLLDTVIHNKTGLLGKSKKDLVDNIVYLLKDRKKAIIFGENGVEFVKDKFSYKTISNQWLTLFKAVKDNKEIQVKGIAQFPLNDYKLLRESFRISKKYFPPLRKVSSFKKIKDYFR